MEDDKTTTDEVDTSTNEEALDTDTALEDMETSFDDVEDTEETDDSEDEIQDTEPAESEEESEEDDEQSEAEEPEESSDEESKEEDTPSAEEIRQHNKEMAERRIAEKRAREEAKNQQQLEYLQGAKDEQDLALRQLQVEAYNNKVTANTNTLANGIEKAVAKIELFRTGSPEVKEALAESLDTFERLHVQYDENGEPMKVDGDVYEYLTKEADKIERLVQTGVRKQSSDKGKARARTQPIPSRAPKEPKVDPDMAAFDEEVAKWS